jgi:hypothetical protein
MIDFQGDFCGMAALQWLARDTLQVVTPSPRLVLNEFRFVKVFIPSYMLMPYYAKTGHSRP